MNYTNKRVAETAELLKQRLGEVDNKTSIMRAVELKALFDELKTLPTDQRKAYGEQVNALRAELQELVDKTLDQAVSLKEPIDVTAPFDLNQAGRLELLPSQDGSQHPLTAELDQILSLFSRMGFMAVESREIDDDYHMFSSLNFPEDHPARDDYDTFMTSQLDRDGKPFIAPAHTSTMQNRILKAHKQDLDKGQPIAAVIPGRVFRNEDLDARHEHTFYQFEGVYVDKGINVGHLIATLKAFLQGYYAKELEVKIQPFYFPFTEPSFEFALSCPFCDKKGCSICSQTGWIELLGCGMIHPNVLHEAGIDVNVYTGFAWGCGLERLVMMKYGIEDVRYFASGRLDFLRQFS